MRNTVFLTLAIMVAATSAFAGVKIAGFKNTTIDEPFCSG
jgi:hypothetical protein